VKRNRRPSGRKLGQKCAQSALGSFVRAVIAPPSAETRKSPASLLTAIVPSAAHAPPYPDQGPMLSVTSRTGPPAADTRFNAPPAKNPRSRESGDQKGMVASSVPASGCDSPLARSRIHRNGMPSSRRARYATRLASGEMAGAATSLPSV
jgi:hypothetical protein